MAQMKLVFEIIVPDAAPARMTALVREARRQIVLIVLKQHAGNITKAAGWLGTRRTYLSRLAHGFGVRGVWGGSNGRKEARRG